MTRPSRKRGVWFALTILLLTVVLLAAWAERISLQERRNQAFLDAVKADDKTRVVALLDQGVDVNAQDRGESPSFSKVLLRMLQRLRSHGVPPEERYHPTALMIATESVEAVIRYPVPPFDPYHGDRTAELQDPELALLLLNYGADANIHNEVGFTPLRNAVQTHEFKVVRKLLEKGAAVDTPDQYGITPLMVADADTAQLLVAHGANINARDRFGRTPLFMVWKGPVYLKLMVAHGADVNARDRDGLTPLLAAARNGASDAIKVLCSHGADINAKDKHGNGVLSWGGRVEMLFLLKQLGAKEK